MQGLFDGLCKRGCIARFSEPEDEVRTLIDGGATVYQGFDPTSASLHVGHLSNLVTDRRLQAAGVRVIALIGGATALIGDPTGREDGRQLLTRAVVDANAAAIQEQLERMGLLRFGNPAPGEQAAVLVNNADWLNMALLTYLRDVAGKFSVNTLLRQETFARRIEAGRHLSLLEFQYPALQAFDFLHLFRTEGCTVQVGGSDQWGNIVAGIDFVRHATEAEGSPARVHGMVFPLLLDRGTGQKMGKTSNGQTVWLDPSLTSPFAFFQYWLGTPDEDLHRNLALFTFLLDEEVEAVVASGPRAAQRRLAFEVTALVHGRGAAGQAEEDSRAHFSRGSCTDPIESVPVVPLTAVQLEKEPTLASVLVLAKVAPSLSAARRLIEQGAVRLNGQRITAVGHRLTPDDMRGAERCAALLQYGRGKALRVAGSG